MTREDKRRLREQARGQYAEHWLAPFASEEEKKLLRTWEKRGRLSLEELKLIDKWINDPEAIKRDQLFVYAAKKKFLGEVVYETAKARHSQLDDTEWLVAYFTAQSKGQKRIASLTHLSERTIDDIIRRLKDRITQEFGCDLDEVGIPHITRWFFGL